MILLGIFLNIFAVKFLHGVHHRQIIVQVVKTDNINKEIKLNENEFFEVKLYNQMTDLDIRVLLGKEKIKEKLSVNNRRCAYKKSPILAEARTQGPKGFAILKFSQENWSDNFSISVQKFERVRSKFGLQSIRIKPVDEFPKLIICDYYGLTPDQSYDGRVIKISYRGKHHSLQFLEPKFLPPFEFKFNVNIESVNIPEGADPLNIVFMSQIHCVDRPENQFYFDSKPGYMRMDITFLDQICPGGKYQLKVQMTEPSKTQPKTLEILYYEYQNDGMVECPDPIINEGQKGINYVINYNFHAQSNCHQKIEPITVPNQLVHDLANSSLNQEDLDLELGLGLPNNVISLDDSDENKPEDQRKHKQKLNAINGLTNPDFGQHLTLELAPPEVSESVEILEVQNSANNNKPLKTLKRQKTLKLFPSRDEAEEKEREEDRKSSSSSYSVESPFTG